MGRLYSELANPDSRFYLVCSKDRRVVEISHNMPTSTFNKSVAFFGKNSIDRLEVTLQGYKNIDFDPEKLNINQIL